MKKTLLFLTTAAGMLLTASCSHVSNEAAQGQQDHKVKKVTDYLYEATFDTDFDYSLSQAGFEKFRPKLPACSSISLGNFRGRNLDWYYEDGSEFVLRANKTANRHASLAVVSAPFLTNEKAGDGQYHQEFELLPYATMDGINDAGVCVNINVVLFQEFGKWQMKTETTDDDMMEFMAPRVILDNCGSLSDVIPVMEKYDWFSAGSEFETHLMVSGPRSSDDKTISTVVFEYIPFTENGKTFRKLCCISQDEKDIVLVGGDAARFYHSKADVFVMTNFNLWQFDASLDRKGRLLSATANPVGFERYEILEAAGKTALNLVGKDSLVSQHIQDVMFTVNYSNMYNIYQDNFWYSESCPNLIDKDDLINATEQQRSPHGNLNNLIKGKDNKFINGFKDILKNWGKRDRKVKSDLWETLHTSIYNYETRSLEIGVREGAVYYEYKL